MRSILTFCIAQELDKLAINISINTADEHAKQVGINCIKIRSKIEFSGVSI